MITELLQLYERIQREINTDVPFSKRRIHWAIDLDKDGEVISVSPTVSRNTDGKGKTKEVLGKEYRCPAAFFLKLKNSKVVAAAGGGNVPPELLSGKPLQVFGEEPIIKKNRQGNVVERKVKKVESGTPKSNHQAFLDLHDLFLSSLPPEQAQKPEWAALRMFFKKKKGIPFDAFSGQDLAQLTKDQRFSFRINGQLLLQHSEATGWWREAIKKQREDVRQWLPQGRDPFVPARDDSALSVRFPHIQGVPNGGGYCPIASFDKAPMQSFGLGEITMPLSLETAEKVSASLNWLLNDETSYKRMGDAVAVFWAVDQNTAHSAPQSLNFGDLLSEADPLQVREFLDNAWGGYAQFPETSKFHAAVLSSPQSRITIRSWHTETLPQAVAQFRKWLRLTSLPNQWGDEVPTAIGQLAASTVQKGKNSKPLPRTYSELFEAALFGRPLSSRLFAAALQRQALELAKGCDKQTRIEFERRLRARTALIKLHFELNKQGGGVTMENHTSQRDSAYLCGRLLALLDKIHVAAHEKSGGTHSSPANRAYTAASTTPALIFPQLCKLARYHLNKVGGGLASCLEHGYKTETGEQVEGLKQVVAKLQDVADRAFPRTLSLEQQGHFAIGFYYERCRKWPSAKKKNAVVGDEKQN